MQLGGSLAEVQSYFPLPRGTNTPPSGSALPARLLGSVGSPTICCAGCDHKEAKVERLTMIKIRHGQMTMKTNASTK